MSVGQISVITALIALRGVEPKSSNAKDAAKPNESPRASNATPSPFNGERAGVRGEG